MPLQMARKSPTEMERRQPVSQDLTRGRLGAGEKVSKGEAEKISFGEHASGKSSFAKYVIESTNSDETVVRSLNI